MLDFRAAESTATELAAALPSLRIALLHGRLSGRDKADVMGRFKAGEIDLLVATTVVEVGVDVPNATLMVIENPERLGLAQLHQLRGRVGRGSERSHCVLLYKPPLGEQSRARLKVMRETTRRFPHRRRRSEAARAGRRARHAPDRRTAVPSGGSRNRRASDRARHRYCVADRHVAPGRCRRADRHLVAAERRLHAGLKTMPRRGNFRAPSILQRFGHAVSPPWTERPLSTIRAARAP